MFSDGFRDGTYLHPGQPYWGLLTNDEAARMDVSNVIPLLHDDDESENHSDEDKPEEKQCKETSSESENANDDRVPDITFTVAIKQVDGGITPESLSPITSTETSPEQKIQSETLSERSARHNQRTAWREQLETSKSYKQFKIHGTRSTTSNPVLEEFIDDDYEDQGSIFGDIEEDHFYSELFSRVHNSEDDVREQSQSTLQVRAQLSMPEPTLWSCYPRLQPEETIIPGQVYRLPDMQVISQPQALSPNGLRQHQPQPPPAHPHPPGHYAAGHHHHHHDLGPVHDVPRQLGLTNQFRRMLRRMDVLNLFKKQ